MALPGTQKRSGRGVMIWNILTCGTLLGVICFASVFLLIFSNPYSSLNPFPPPTMPGQLVLMTITPTSTSLLPATWTPTSTTEPTPSPTPRPSFTPVPSATPFTIDMLFSPTPTPTLTRPPQGYPYEVLRGSPLATQNIYHPELECAWMGVGGQVFDINNAPVIGLIVHLGGNLPGVALQTPLMSLTGVALNYGPSGYEFQLADQPIASRKSLWIQLLDQQASPVSDKIFFDTFADCNRNLILVNFKRVR